MNKAQLTEEIANQMGVSKKEADGALTAVFDVITRAVAKGEKVAIPGVGSFEASERPARTSRNPRTGEPVEVPAATVPKFKAAAGFKELVSSGS